ncbi:MAG: extracellular solute-binding protein [Spirochaetes bacterium]|nr:extracellular solute-binding protein [Spirochaetota bacterium]
MKRIILILSGICCLFMVVSCKKNSSQTEQVKIRWFIGLGAGTDDGTLKAQQQVVDDFNKAHNNIELVMEIIDNSEAYDTLATQMSAGNAPDIVGPVGIRGRDSFKGAWLDLEPLVKKHEFDLSHYDPELVNFYKVEGEGLIGLPFAVYPSFIYFNKDLFDDAGLPYPPQKYGEPYIDENGNQKEWNMETMIEIAQKLTIDKNGNEAKDPQFDSSEIIQFGFGIQWADARAQATLFGSGSLVGNNGDAQIPENWKKGWQWIYDAKWKYHFFPYGQYDNAEFLGGGNWFQSGNIAMVQCHLWYAGFAKIQDLNWDLAVLPAYQGQVTAKLHADTFEIMKSSKHPDEAFEVLSYLVTNKKLLNVYGGMPADKRHQSQFLQTFGKEKFPGHAINWKVAIESLKYADHPSHEGWMPGFQESSAAYSDFFTLLNQDGKLDVNKEILLLEEKLQKVFDQYNAHQ